MQGFLVLDYLPHAEKALEEIGTWVMEGKIKHIEDVQEGLRTALKLKQTFHRSKLWKTSAKNLNL